MNIHAVAMILFAQQAAVPAGDARQAEAPAGKAQPAAVAPTGDAPQAAVPAGDAQEAEAPAGEPAPASPGFANLLMPFALIMVVYYFLIVVPDRKRGKQKQSLLESLKKNDKVITVGGIHAVVANVKGDEVTLKVDEDKDVKIRVGKASITQVVTGKQDSASKDKE